MALAMAQVTALADNLADVALRLSKLIADARRVSFHNTKLNVAWTPATKVCTVANATDIFTSTAHGFLEGQKLRFTNSGGILPVGLAINTDYFVIAANLAANTFQVSTTRGGATINVTSDGTGTHTAVPVPDYIDEETGVVGGNISGKIYTRVQISNALGSLQELLDYWDNAAVTQGDHGGNLTQITRGD